jgi:glyoxylase-like metal-dependent hydrolase (beta-lactamase superfamily II)
MRAGKVTDDQDALRFPYEEAPATGLPIEVAPGILWVRFPLPFRLDHVNIYLIDDGDGYAVVDTGISDDVTRAAWRALMAGPLAGKRLTRVIVTHFHPDHIGLAGWLWQEFETPLLTSQTSFLMCNMISLTPGAAKAQPYQDFYLRHGMDAETARLVSTQGHQYLGMVTPLPPTFRRLLSGDTLVIGSRQFRVYTGDGHAPEQIMLYLEEEKILLAADQVIAKITPNIGVWAVDPEGDPLGHYLRSLRLLEAHVPEDTLVLPGHQLPFYGLNERCRQIVNHHEDRCRMIADACAGGPKSVAELVPVVFHRPLDPHQMSFAFSETHAHVNRMIRRGELAWIERDGNFACALAG